MFSLAITLAAHELPVAELLLQHLGALSTSIAEPQDCTSPIYEPPIDSHPIWPQASLIAHFEHPQNVEQITNSLESLLQHAVSVRSEALNEKDWQAAYQRHFKPQIIDQQLCVSAPWHDIDTSYPVQFTINPGIAFGTGTHPTTRLCLQWLVNNRPTGSTVLDFGCGSGILSLCAYALGSGHVTAIDIDPQAISATQANIHLNAYPTEAFQLLTSAPNANQQFDLIVANILYTPLIELRDQFAERLSQDGRLVVSGILSSQTESLIAHYQDTFCCQLKTTLDDWSLLQFKASIG